MDWIIDIFQPVVVSAVLSVAVSAILTYYLGMRAKHSEYKLKYKEEQYSKLIVKLQGFVGNTANMETKKEFFEVQYRLWLCASGEVIQAIDNMICFIKEGKTDNISESCKLIGKIVEEMRKDLYGKKRTRLDASVFQYTDVI